MQGHVPAARRRDADEGQGRPAGAAARLRHDPARGDRGGRAARARTSAWPPTSGAARASPSCAATASTPSAGTCCIRPRRRGVSYVEQCLAGRPGGPGDRRDRLHAGVRRPDPALSWPRRYRVLGTDGFGRSDYRAQAARLLRGRPALRRRSPRWASWPTRARLPAAVAADAITKYGIDPEKPAPAPGLSIRSTSMEEADRHDSSNRGQGSRHRRLQGRPDHRDPRASPATRSTPRTRWSRWSPTRRPWTCRPRPAGTVAEVLVKVGDRVSEGTPILLLTPRRRRAEQPTAVAGRAAGARPPRQHPPHRHPPAAARPRAAGIGDPGRRCMPARRVRRTGARARRRPGRGQGHRREGPDHQGRRAGLPARARPSPLPQRPRRRGRHRASRRSRRRTSPSSGPIETKPLSRIKSSPGRSCTAPGSTSRTSRTTTRPTSPSWTPTARNSTPPPRRERLPGHAAGVPDEGQRARR